MITSLPLSQPALTPSIPIPPPAPATAAGRKDGGSQQEYLRFTLQDVLVSS